MRIEYFRELLTLVETENYLSAAETLHISQSTLSRHVMITEQYFGIKIFNRDVKHFSVTKSGEYLLRYAAEIVEMYDSYQKNLQTTEAVEANAPPHTPTGETSTI